MAKENTSLKNNLDVLILPNPATDQFTMQLNSNGASGKASPKNSDAPGKVLKIFSNIRAGETLRFGSEFRAGIYMAEIIIGSERKTYKPIKL